MDKIDDLVIMLLKNNKNQNNTISFLWTMCAIDNSKIVFKSLLRNISILEGSDNLFQKQIIKEAMEKDDPSVFFNSDFIIDDAFKHWMLLKNLKLIDFFIEESKKKFFRLQVSLKLIVGFLSILTDGEEKIWSQILRVLLKILNSEIILNFEDQKNEIQGAISKKYIINNVLKTGEVQKLGIIEETKYEAGT